MSFYSLIDQNADQNRFVCVGLDSDSRKIPAFLKGDMLAFNKKIIDATKDSAGCYKIQVSYYEAEGEAGWEAMRETVAYLREAAPGTPVIADAKRADIGSTNEGYVKAFFDTMGFDAITVQPYLGGEALKPFLEREDKGIIVLCRTSNLQSAEFQMQQVVVDRSELDKSLPASLPGREFFLNQAALPLYQYVATRVAYGWNTQGNCLLVVGATYPEEARIVRSLVGDMPFLVPGIGTQGGSLSEICAAAANSQKRGLIINSSRGIIFASDREDFAERAGEEARELNQAISNELSA